MTGKTVDDLHPGDEGRFSKTLSESDIYLFAGVTGDFSPAHVNEVFAKGSFFGGRIAHGLLTAGLISTVIATSLPGPGSIYLRQELDFTAPVYAGDTITAHAKVLEVDAEKNRVLLETVCTNQKGRTVIKGRALVSPPKKQ